MTILSMVVWLVIGTSKSLRVGCRPSNVELVKKYRLLVARREGCDSPLAALRCRSRLDVASVHDP